MEKTSLNATIDNKHPNSKTVDPGDQFPLPTFPDLPSSSSLSSSARSSLSDAGVLKQIHPPTPDMEGGPTDKRREKDAQLGADSNKELHERRQRWRRRNTEGKYPEGEDSMLDHSSRSTSEDVELNSMSDDSADEEMGLTGKGRGDRRRKKRKNTQLDGRIAGESKVSDEVQKQADQSVVRKSLVNALLIGSWYVHNSTNTISGFLLTHLDHLGTSSHSQSQSTTNGCSRTTTSTFPSHSSQPACTCSSNSPSRPASSTSSPTSDPATTPSATRTTIPPQPKQKRNPS